MNSKVSLNAHTKIWKQYKAPEPKNVQRDTNVKNIIDIIFTMIDSSISFWAFDMEYP